MITSKKTAIERTAAHGFDNHPEVTSFREDMILHKRFQNSLDGVAERIQYGEQQSITAVLGPTGSGKTALTRELEYEFDQAMKEVPAPNQSTLLSMEIAAPEQGAFKWKDDFYIPALIALREPCVTKKIDVYELRKQVQTGDMRLSYLVANRRIPEYRNDFYCALERARVLAALFDEANHFRRPTTKNGIFGQYDSLKSRSNSCRTHFVLLGTTELADIFSQSGSISKRVYPIWLSPYGTDEIKYFGEALAAIIEKLPRRITFSASSKLRVIFESCLGLIGLLHDWFDRALVRCIAHEGNVISWADMEAVRPDPFQLAGIVRELIAYRTISMGIKSYLKEQMNSLFLPVTAGGTRETKNSPKKPGVRNPVRDPVSN